MSGLEVLGAVAASLEIVKVATACLKLLNGVRDIDLNSRDQEFARFYLLVQGLKFERWCLSLGIDLSLRPTEPEKRRNGDEISALDEILISQLRLKSADMQKATRSALHNLHHNFDEAATILRRYTKPLGSDSPTPESASQDTKKSSKPSKWKSFLRKEPASAPRRSDSPSELVGGSKSKTVSAISLSTRWLTTDKSEMDKLLSGIEKTNELLLVLLQPSLRAQVGRRTDMAILDHVDQRNRNITQTLPEDSSLRALANIKQWQDHQQKEEQDEGTSMSSSATMAEPQTRRLRPYHVEDFKKGTLRHGEYRSSSVLNSQDVMVEWKYYNKDHPVRMEQTLRLGGLVSLLNRRDLYERFSTLPCIGLVNDASNSRIGIVFNTDGTRTDSMRTLQDAINKAKTPPPIGDRFVLARNLATALHHLHSVHWFHKSIRSDNVVAFSPSSSESQPSDKTSNGLRASGGGPIDYREETELETAIPRSETLSQPPIPLPSFYLVGWDLSRPDHPSELSETLSISTAGYQSKRDAIQMYSHPLIHAKPGSGKKPRFRAEFDIYSMGLVLLEIGLWGTLDRVWAKSRDDDEFRLRVRTEYCDRLLSKMGVVYWRVVQRCLGNDFGIESDGRDASIDSFSLQEAYEKHVVSELEKCFA